MNGPWGQTYQRRKEGQNPRTIWYQEGSLDQGWVPWYTVPKASWVPYNPFPSYRIPCNPMGSHFLHKTIFFWAPFLVQKGPRPSRNPPGSKSGIWGPKNRSRGRTYCTKVACRKTMQNPVVGIPSGAICCKLWPKTIFGRDPVSGGVKVAHNGS